MRKRGRATLEIVAVSGDKCGGRVTPYEWSPSEVEGARAVLRLLRGHDSPGRKGDREHDSSVVARGREGGAEGGGGGEGVDRRQAESLVRREMWCRLGFLALQTASFMRLTFWELSWDVMEPIKTHFAAKQRRLIKTHNFDMERFD
ncbi:calcium uniporter protein 2, mitochondrial-like [Canna indica]|uniref:Calcium uniporter protein 2, mitochondrial-like n=1 Tax=Canna indica TaxID=4628 RepID=A0AAQ3JTG2_9LILI|nr:calcium uniporter protein 2, mitochondrial-like [Canna indica]